MTAAISSCKRYRYTLSRVILVNRVETDPHSVLFVMLNPSTADANFDDPTIRRCKGFAERFGAVRMSVVNLYAFRATKPADLWNADDPVGPENDAYIFLELLEHDFVICAWGAHAKPERVTEFLQLAKDADAGLFCLGTTKGGSPRHPLYLRKDAPLDRFDPTPGAEQ